VTPASEANQAKVKKILNENPFVDFIEVDLVGLNMNVMFTLLPEGLKKVPGGAQRLGLTPQGVEGLWTEGLQRRATGGRELEAIVSALRRAAERIDQRMARLRRPAGG
jgi:hypothetical protein